MLTQNNRVSGSHAGPRMKILIWSLSLFGTISLLVLCGFFYLRFESPVYDTAIINAVIHDGTGTRKAFTGGVGIKGDKIAAVWSGTSWPKPRAQRLIDAKGADLAPGFIDTHSHADLSILGTRGKIRADNFLGQGITTMIVGNCGGSATDISAFAANVKERQVNVNIATLVGLGSVRKKVMKESNQPASHADIAKMCDLVRAGMGAGALGVSTGYAYPPGCFASRNEIVAQLKVAAELGGIHATHMRNEGNAIIAAAEEVLSASKEASIPLVISHIKITGLRNSRHFDGFLRLIAQARAEGMRVQADQYPYDSSSTNLNIFLPEWFLALDRKDQYRTLTTAHTRTKLKEEIGQLVEREGFHDFSFATVSYYRPHREWQGKTLDQIDLLVRRSTTSTMDTQVDIFLEMVSHGGAQMVYRNICPDIMEMIPRKEVAMVGTDSAIRDSNMESIPHPRGWGCFPKFIRYFVTEKRILSLDEAIHRVTGLPAQVFSIKNRGRIEKGFFADIVVFDAKTIEDQATYGNPFQPPLGIKYVMVNGRIAVEAATRNVDGRIHEEMRFLDVFPGMYVSRSITR